MRRLSYTPLVKPWKVNLVRSRARRMGFSSDELPDVLQELIPCVMAFRYNPAHANGATEATALKAIIDNRLKAICRANARYRLRLERLANEPTPEQDDLTPLCRTLDVATAVALLPEREQTVCRALAAGKSCQGVARCVGCSWHAARRLIDRIRDHFRAHGLDGYLHA